MLVSVLSAGDLTGPAFCCFLFYATLGTRSRWLFFNFSLNKNRFLPTLFSCRRTLLVTEFAYRELNSALAQSFSSPPTCTATSGKHQSFSDLLLYLSEFLDHKEKIVCLLIARSFHTTNGLLRKLNIFS